MAACPRCTKPLVKRITPAGVVYGCPKCHGRNVAVPVLRKAGASEDFLKTVRAAAQSEAAVREARCPHCNQPMAQAVTRSDRHVLALDVCRYCNAVWFDGGELAAVPRDPHHHEEQALSEAAREQIALLQLQAMKEEGENGEAGPVGEPPPEWWKWLPAVAGLPVEYEAPAMRSMPLLTWGIAGALVVVFAATSRSLNAAADEWGFIPALWDRHGGLTLLTAFFLHGGLWHLFSNIYFLLIFGDNVEDNLGRGLYAAMLAGAALFGNLAHAAFDPRGMLPCVGASGGICGIIGYYAVAFPNARLGFLWRWLTVLRWVSMPAWAALVLFLAVQGLGAWQQVEGFGGVSCLAHLGGLAVGIAAGVAVRLARSRET